MKYGIDIKDEYFGNIIKEGLKKKGHNIISCTDNDIPILGEAIMKKAILANQTKIDVYVQIDLSTEKTHELKIVTGFKKAGMALVESIGEKLKEAGFQDIVIENGDKLYLIKHIDSPVIILEVRIGDKSARNEIAEKLVNVLSCIND